MSTRRLHQFSLRFCRSQTAVETIVVFSAFLLTLALLFAWSFDTTSSVTYGYDSLLVRSFFDTLLVQGQTVLSEGNGSSRLVYLTLPNSLYNATLANNTVFLQVGSIEGTTNTFVRYLGFNATGILPTSGGTYAFVISNNMSVVQIRN
jgi:hypothetical protein